MSAEYFVGNSYGWLSVIIAPFLVLGATIPVISCVTEQPHDFVIEPLPHTYAATAPFGVGARNWIQGIKSMMDL